MAVELSFFPTSGSSTGSGSFACIVTPDKGVINYIESITKKSGSSHLSASGSTTTITVSCSTSTPGTYTASFTVVARVEESGGYHSNASGTLSVTYTVKASVITVTAPTMSGGDATYDKSTHTVTYSGGSSSGWSKGGTYSASAAGTYTAKAVLTNTTDYKWSDGTTADRTYSWTISKRSLTKPSLSPHSFTYTGETQSPTENNYNSTYETRSSSSTTSAKNVGKYYYYWTLDDTSNTQWSDGSTSQHSDWWEITKGTNTVTFTTTSASIDYGGSMTRTGSAKWGSVSYSSSNESVATVSSSGVVTGVGAGTATITCTSSSSSNYSSQSKSFTLTVNKASNPVTFTTTAVTKYVGETFTRTGTCTFGSVSYSSDNSNIASVNSSGLVTCKAAGSTYINCDSPSTSNYTGEQKYFKITVNKYSQSWTLGTTSLSLSGITKTGTSTISGTAYGTVSVSTSSSSIATASVSGSTVTVMAVGAGTATITVTATGNSTYNARSQTISVTVTKSTPTITWASSGKPTEVAYGETTSNALSATSSSGMDVTYSIADTTIAELRSGNYIKGKKVGATNITASCVATSLFTAGSNSYEFSVVKAHASKNNPTGKTGLGYNGTTQTLYNNGSSSHGSFTMSGDTSAYNAGTYTVSWTFTPDSSHYVNPSEASGSFSVSIAKASVTYKPDDVTIYPGQSFTQGYTKVSGTVYSGDTPISNILYSYDGRSSADIPRQKGTYEIAFASYTADNNYAITTQKGTLTVTAIPVNIPTLSGSYTYTGTNQTVTVTGYDSSLMTQSGTATAKNASTYTVSWALKDINQYEWSDGTTSTKSDQWTISKKDLTLSWGTVSWAYDGTSHSTTCSATGTVASETVGVELGNNFVGPTVGYTDVTFIEFTGTYKDNYQLKSTESTTKRITITAKPITLTWGTLSWVYDGSSHSTTCTVTEKVGSDNVTVSLEGNSVGPNVSSDTVTARGLLGTDARNYEISSSAVTSQTLSITKAPGSWTTKPTGRTSTYDGTAKPLCWEGTTSTGTPMYRSETGSYSTSIPTDTEADNAFNNHRVYFYVSGDGNHYDTEEEYTIGSIKKADQSWTLTSTIALSGLTPTGNISISGTTYGTVSASTSEYYTAGTWSNNTCKITAVKATPTGGVNITVTAPGDSNHNSLSRTCACTITRSKTTITFDESSPSNVDVGQRTVDPIVAICNATDVHLVYRSADTDIAIMVSGAHVEGVHAGQTEIIAYHEQTGLWEAGEAGWDFIVEKIPQTLTFQYDSIRLDLPAFSFSNAITSATYGAITATSSNPSAVRIQSQNDPITGTWAGQTNTTVTVSVTVAGDRDHSSAFGSFTVIVGGGGGGNAHPCAIYEWNGSRWVELIPYVWTGTAWAQAMSVTYD